MKPNFLALLLLTLFSISGLAQKSVSELPTAQSNALQEYLKNNPDLKFLSEKSYDQEYLKAMREGFGQSFTPFYRQGDLNSDGVPDFAVILKKNIPPIREPDLAETHQLQYTVVVVVFNGAKDGTYKSVFSLAATVPLVCFLNIEGDKKKRLYFGVYETDDGFILTPTKNGYKAEYLYTS